MVSFSPPLTVYSHQRENLKVVENLKGVVRVKGWTEVKSFQWDCKFY